MEKYLAEYLLKYGNCPLPGNITMHLKNFSAKLNQSARNISSPVSEIQLVQEDNQPQNVITHLSEKMNIDVAEVSTLLTLFSDQVKNLSTANKKEFAGLGSFSVDAAGNLIFENEDVDYIFPDLPMTRVVRQGTQHSVLVGDKETLRQTQTVDTEIVTEIPKDRYWIWALLLIIVSVLLILYYFFSSQSSAGWGNGMRVL